MEERLFQSVGVEAVLLTNPANMRYVAGFTGEGYVYLSNKKKVVVTDSRYTIAAREECQGFEVVEWGKDGYFVPLADCIRQEDGLNTLGIEDASLTLAMYRKIEQQLKETEGLSVELMELGQKVSDLRQIKTPEEHTLLRHAEAIGDRAFTKTLPHIEAGMTEKQVAAWLEFYMKEEGAEAFSFETIAASGVHSAMPHAVPTDKQLENGDFLTMDFGCVYCGYCSDMTRTVVIGQADARQRKIYETVLLAQETALQGIRPGLTGREIDALARDVIVDAGYGDCFGHSLGHSVGLEIHERPNFSSKEETIIQPGMVVTVEPGIYIEGFGGVRIEDVVIVTETGCENITHSPKELIECREIRRG